MTPKTNTQHYQLTHPIQKTGLRQPYDVAIYCRETRTTVNAGLATYEDLQFTLWENDYTFKRSGQILTGNGVKWYTYWIDKSGYRYIYIF